MNSKIDQVWAKEKRWRVEFQKLRSIILNCGLTEDLKWGQACYSLDGGNVVLIHGFKDYCALLFFKGALMKDPHKVLVQQTKNVQSARQIRFTGLQDILEMGNALTAYVHDAIAVQKSGAKMEFKKTAEFEMPEEFQTALKMNAKLKKAFQGLTPGRQRGYILYFSGAKQAKTRVARIEKCAPNILMGKGLDD